MTVSLTSQPDLLAKQLLVDSGATSTAQKNVLLGAATVYYVQIENTNPAASAVYLKLWDSQSPTVGTTEPDYVIMCPAIDTQALMIAEGLVFSTGLSYACTQNAAVSDTTAPSQTVVVKMVLA